MLSLSRARLSRMHSKQKQACINTSTFQCIDWHWTTSKTLEFYSIIIVYTSSECKTLNHLSAAANGCEGLRQLNVLISTGARMSDLQLSPRRRKHAAAAAARLLAPVVTVHPMLAAVALV